MQKAGKILDFIWLGLVTFVAATTLSAAALSLGGLRPAATAIGLLLGLLTAGFAVWQARRDLPGEPAAGHWFWRYAVCFAFAIFSLRAFLWLIFLKGDKVAVLSPNNLGDLPLHIQYIRFFSQGAPLWPVNPIHAHSTIGYPFGIDYFNAVLDLCGIPLWNALLCTGLLGALATGIALYRWGGAFTMAGFLFNGGAAGLLFFTTGKWIDYQQEVDWKSIPLALFVTQRGFLYALPAGLLLLVHWRKMLRPENARTLPFWLEIGLYASMPLFHIHTFLFLSLIAGALALFSEKRRHFCFLIAAALLPASGLMFLLTDGFHGGNSLGWQPGWMEGPTFSWVYWLRNFGLFPLFALVLLIFLIVQRQKTALIFVGSACALLVATCFIKFSPWAWDNTKLMMWSYLAILPFLWKTLVKMTNPVAVGGVCLILFTSGFISLWGGLNRDFDGFPIADQHAVLAVGEATRSIPIQEIFASASDYAHPLVLNGRRLALGYLGHMVGHGLPYRAEKRDLDTLMSGGAGWEKAARNLGVHYVFWGESEEQNWPTSEKPWISDGKLVADGDWGQIYRIDPDSTQRN